MKDLSDPIARKILHRVVLLIAKLGNAPGTKMNEAALAVCLAPTLFSRDVLDKLDAMAAAKMSLQMNRAVSDIVARRQELFPEPYVSSTSLGQAG
jgi:hypothetical protein